MSLKRFVQSELGRCDFLDVLEEAVLLRVPVRLERTDGTRIEGIVQDVATDADGETVHLSGSQRVSVSDISSLEREPKPGER